MTSAATEMVSIASFGSIIDVSIVLSLEFVLVVVVFVFVGGILFLF